MVVTMTMVSEAAARKVLCRLLDMGSGSAFAPLAISKILSGGGWSCSTSSKCRFDVPPSFPRELAMRNYCHPKVSTPEQLHSLRALKNGWNLPLNEEKVRDFISTRFNMWTKSYMDWIGPILLLRSLVNASPGQKANKHDLNLVRKRKKKDEVADSAVPDSDEEIKVTFSAKSVTSLNFNQLDFTLPGHWTGKACDPTDLEYRPECEILNCFLRHALPDDVLAPPPSKSAASSGRKRKAGMENDDEGEEVKPVKRQRAKTQENGDDNPKPKKRGRPKKDAANGPTLAASSEPPSSASKAVFRLPTSHFSLPLSSLEQLTPEPSASVSSRAVSSISSVTPVDLVGSSSEDDVEDERADEHEEDLDFTPTFEEEMQLYMAMDISMRELLDLGKKVPPIPHPWKPGSFSTLSPEMQELMKKHYRPPTRKILNVPRVLHRLERAASMGDELSQERLRKARLDYFDQRYYLSRRQFKPTSKSTDHPGTRGVSARGGTSPAVTVPKSLPPDGSMMIDLTDD